MITTTAEQEIVPSSARKSFRADWSARQKVATSVKELIRTRGMLPGDKLPSYAQLIEELSFSLMTVKRGMDDLVAEGVIHRQHGSGCYVAKELTLMSRTLKRVGVIYPATRQLLFELTYLTEIMRGLTCDVAQKVDIHIFSLREDGLVNAAQLGEAAVDGVILLGVENDAYLSTFAQWGTPGVVVDYCSQAVPLDYVACDNRAAASQMAAHLVALGHRRTVYVTQHSQQPVGRPDVRHATLLVRDSSDVHERLDASVAALSKRGLLADVWNISDFTGNQSDELFRRMRSAHGPTVLVTDSNYAAIGLHAVLARRGLRVPEDISVCSVASDGCMALDNHIAFEGHPLTCCRFNFVDMGKKAIEQLAARCRNPRLDKPRVHRIGFAFVEGETTGRVKQF